MWPFFLAGRSKDTVHVTYARSLCRQAHTYPCFPYIPVYCMQLFCLYFPCSSSLANFFAEKYTLPLTYFYSKSSSKNASKSLSIPKSGTTTTIRRIVCPFLPCWLHLKGKQDFLLSSSLSSSFLALPNNQRGGGGRPTLHEYQSRPNRRRFPRREIRVQLGSLTSTSPDVLKKKMYVHGRCMMAGSQQNIYPKMNAKYCGNFTSLGVRGEKETKTIYLGHGLEFDWCENSHNTKFFPSSCHPLPFHTLHTVCVRNNTVCYPRSPIKCFLVSKQEQTLLKDLRH